MLNEYLLFHVKKKISGMIDKNSTSSPFGEREREMSMSKLK